MIDRSHKLLFLLLYFSYISHIFSYKALLHNRLHLEIAMLSLLYNVSALCIRCVCMSNKTVIPTVRTLITFHIQVH